MNKKDQTRIKKIIKRLASLQQQIEDTYGEICVLADELRDRYDDESKYNDDAQYDADCLDDIYSNNYDNAYDSIDSAIDSLNDFLDEPIDIEIKKAKAFDTHDEGKNTCEYYLKIATDFLLKELENRKSDLDEPSYLKYKFEAQHTNEVFQHVKENNGDYVETYNDLALELKNILDAIGVEEKERPQLPYMLKGFS